MKQCDACGRLLPEISRFCTQCGARVESPQPSSDPSRDASSQQLNLQILYAMVAALLLALIFPPWESPPTQPPEFLGFAFILTPPRPDAIVSRLLLTIELVTIAMAGLYGSWLFRNTASK